MLFRIYSTNSCHLFSPFCFHDEFFFCVRYLDHGKTLYSIDSHFIKNINRIFISSVFSGFDNNNKIPVKISSFPIAVKVFYSWLFALFPRIYHHAYDLSSLPVSFL